jgi:PAS domain S-box-containing protein
VLSADQGDLLVTGNDKRGSLIWRLRNAWPWLTKPTASTQEADRKRAREALRASEIRYRALFDGVPVGLYRTTPAGQIIDANPALVQVLGYPDRASLLAVNAADLYAEPEDRRQELALLEREGVVRDFETRLRRPDGAVIWVRDSTRDVRDASGEVLYYEGSLVDITERKRAEEALRKERDRVQEYLNTAEVMLLVISGEGEITLINRKGCSILGYEEAELIGKNWFDTCIPAQVREDVLSVFRRLMAGEVKPVEYYENPIVTKSGEERTIAWHNSILREQTGDVVGILCSGEDITERQRLEAEVKLYTEHLKDLVAGRTADLHRTAKRVEAILNSTHDAIALARPDGTIQQTNVVFNALLGYEVDEALGHHVTIFVEPDYVESLARTLRAVAEQRRLGRIEVVARRKDGRTFDADAALAPVVISEDRPPSVVLSLRDISHRKEVERLKAQFVANAAHDLSHPIANLKVRLYLLRQAPERLSDVLPVLEDQTGRMDRLVEGLRTLSAVDRGVVSLELAPVDLNALAAEVVNANIPLAEEKRQMLVFEPGEDLPPVAADRFQLERVLVNLVANALDYTPEGGQITVTTGQAEDMCMCAVRDTGMGIAPEDLPHVFERFFRSDRIRKSAREGTGLGLAIAHEIVKAHGGRIAVESELDRGSVFTVWLPVHAGE